MNEAEARAYVQSFDVPRETITALDRFVAMLADENARQNLVAASTLDRVWERHIADSAQLLAHARSREGLWIDLGSGPGFPGLIIAALTERPVVLVEERSKRVAFLQESAALLGIANRVTIAAAKVERITFGPAAVISARAFAPLPRLLGVAAHLANRSTHWVLPKGRSAEAELAEASTAWQGDFRLVPSVTDSEAAIIVATDVHPRKSAR